MAHGGLQAAEGGKMRVVLVGHSYVRRLGEYMTSSPELANLGLRDADVKCVAVGGATLGPHHKPISNHLQAVKDLDPFAIFVHMGENDLGHMSDGQIKFELKSLVEKLSSLCHSRVVIVGQLVPWPRSRDSQRVNHLNGALCEQFAPGTTVFWNHESSLSRSCPELFLPDGVHLNDAGMHRYWRSVRTVVGRVLRHNHPSYH